MLVHVRCLRNISNFNIGMTIFYNLLFPQPIDSEPEADEFVKVMNSYRQTKNEQTFCYFQGKTWGKSCQSYNLYSCLTHGENKPSLYDNSI